MTDSCLRGADRLEEDAFPLSGMEGIAGMGSGSDKSGSWQQGLDEGVFRVRN
jgi:hypothetical protein